MSEQPAPAATPPDPDPQAARDETEARVVGGPGCGCDLCAREDREELERRSERSRWGGW
ncbi:MAG: hypothetical protein M3167_02465 [Acidobacteriota bacterium]|nr:hypothetical protein [Acidobacteriota bacterium]